MNHLQLHIEINIELYSKNPDSSELGRKIISNSITLINKIGFENFTFKKLGLLIDSPESSIYRYFKNKHILLIYLTSWYWSWVEYQLVFSITNVNSATERLTKALYLLTKPIPIDQSVMYINESQLSEIIITESVKAYHTKNVDSENKKGYFQTYKKVVQRVSDLVLEINPFYKYPHMLVSTVIEGANQQKYFAQHLPSLTDTKKGADTISDFYTKMVLEVIK